jgi:hypothetical protein
VSILADDGPARENWTIVVVTDRDPAPGDLGRGDLGRGDLAPGDRG